MDEYIRQIMEQLSGVLPEDKIDDAQKLITNTMLEANKGLEANKNDILGQLADLKKKQSALDKIDISDYNSLKDAKKQLDELLADKARKEGDYEALLEQMEKKHQSALQALEKKIENLEAVNSRQLEKLNQTLIDNGLTDALTKLKVKPELLDASRALLRGKAQLTETEEGDYSALIDGKPMTEYISTWATDEGKAFVSAPVNSGAGSSDGKSNTGKMSLDAISQLPTREERLNAMAENGYA